MTLEEKQAKLETTLKEYLQDVAVNGDDPQRARRFYFDLEKQLTRYTIGRFVKYLSKKPVDDGTLWDFASHYEVKDGEPYLEFAKFWIVTNHEYIDAEAFAEELLEYIDTLIPCDYL